MVNFQERLKRFIVGTETPGTCRREAPRGADFSRVRHDNEEITGGAGERVWKAERQPRLSDLSRSHSGRKFKGHLFQIQLQPLQQLKVVTLASLPSR